MGAGKHASRAVALAVFLTAGAHGATAIEAGRRMVAAVAVDIAASHDAGATAFADGVKAYGAGRDDEAGRLFRRAIARDPANADAHFFLGLVHQRQNELARAVDAFRKALEIRPGFTEARFPLALALYRLKRHDAALRRFGDVLKRDPNDANAHFFMGLIAQEQGDHFAAARHLEQASADEELAASARFNLAITYFKLDRRDEAASQFDTVLRLEPDGDLASGAREYLALIKREAREARRWTLELVAGRERSNNITRAEQDQVTGEQDSAYVLEASGTYRFLDLAGLTGTVGYDFSQTFYDKIKSQDFRSHTGSLSFSRPMGDWEPGLDYSYNHNVLNDRDFLRIQTISPKIAYFPRPDLFSQLGYNLQFKDFHNDRDRDATTHQGAVSQFLFFAEAKGYLLLGLTYEFESAKEDRFDLEALTVSPALQLPLGWAFAKLGSDGLGAAMPSAAHARLGFTYRRKDFTKITPDIDAERLDVIKTYSAKLSTNLIAGLSGALQYEHINTSSNLESVRSAENVYSLVFSYGF